MNKKNLKIVESFDDIEIYKTSAFMNKIAAQAMQEEKEKNKRLGIPSADIFHYSIDACFEWREC